MIPPLGNKDRSRVDDARVAVLVLGMHRSGTSALTRVLSLLGCDLPRSLMGADHGNDLGHWESSEICNFNDELLASGGSFWNDWLPFNPDWYNSPRYASFVRRGGALLRQEFDNSPLFVLKDPRNCRLAPFWLQVLERDGVRPRIVMPVRNPLEVAHSHARRDQMEPAYAQLLWLRHVLDAEAASRGRPRVVTTFDQLLGDWQVLANKMQQAFGFAWPRQSVLTESDVEEFLREDQRHFRAPPDLQERHASLSSWVETAYRVMVDWAKGGESPADYPRLDDLRGQFDAAAPAFAKLVSGDLRRQEMVRQLEQQIAESDQKLSQTSATLIQERDALHQALEALRDANSAVEEERACHEMQASALREECDTLIGQRDALAAECDGFASGRDVALVGLAGAEERLASARAQIEGLQAQVAGGAAAISQLESRLVELGEVEHQRALLLSTLRQREEEEAQTHAELQRARICVAALEAEAVGLRSGNDVLSRKLAEADQWVFRLAGDRKALENSAVSAKFRIAALERSLRDGQAELQRWNDADMQRRQESLQLKAVHEDALRQVAQLQAELSAAVDVAKDQARRGADLHAASEAALHKAENRLNEHFQETARLAQLLLEKDAAVHEASKRASLLEATHEDALRQVAQLQAELSAAVDVAKDQARRGADLHAASEAALHKAENRLNEHFQETARLTQLLLEKDAAVRQASKRAWLQNLAVERGNLPGWWKVMPRKWQLEQERQHLARRGVFDARGYLERNPDVAAAGVDPLAHYIEYGFDEGREI